MKYFNNSFYGDCLILTNYLEELEFNHNWRRKHLNTTSARTLSMLYGLTPYKHVGVNRSRIKDPNSNYYWSLGRMKYPHLYEIFREFSELHFPDFEWSSVMINKNLQCDWHKDKGNIGESIMLGLGDYRGGALYVKYDNEIKKYQTWCRLVRFNGSLYEHCTEKFEGERFTLVFYNNKRF
jgi:hypothetical protein